MLTKTKSRRRKSRKSTDWKLGEVPHCEIDRVEVDERGDLVIVLTPRGDREWQRRRKAQEAEERRVERARRRGDYGIPAEWIIRGTGPARYWG